MKYAFKKSDGEIVAVSDEATVEQYPETGYHLDVHFEDAAYLVAIPQKYRKVAVNVQVGLDGETPIMGDKIVEMSQEEKDAVDAAGLSAVKAARKVFLAGETRAYIESKCPVHNQVTLATLFEMANMDGLTNRAAHIKSFFTWMDTVVAYNQAVQADVDSAADEAAVAAIVQDFSTYDGTWPEVTIASARAITN